MANEFWRICQLDNTIVFVLNSCRQFAKSGNEDKPFCQNCLNAQPTDKDILELLDTMQFKFPIACDKLCLFRLAGNYCGLDWVSTGEGHTEAQCEYGLKRHGELSPV